MSCVSGLSIGSRKTVLGLLNTKLKKKLTNLDVIRYPSRLAKRVADLYFEDGGINKACPPLNALLYIMRDGTFEGKDINHQVIRTMFTKEYLMGSDWYAARLKEKQSIDKALWKRHIQYLKEFAMKKSHRSEARRLDIKGRLDLAERNLRKVSGKQYLEKLKGTIGADHLSDQ